MAPLSPIGPFSPNYLWPSDGRLLSAQFVSRRRLIVVLSTGHLMALHLIELKLIELSFGVFVFGERKCAPEFFDRLGLILTKKDDPAEALALVVQCQI